LFKHIRYFLNGIVIGVTSTVPAVSAGTIAVILGFYDQFTDSVSHFTKQPKKSLKFLIPLGLGLVTGVMAFSALIKTLLAQYSLPTMLFFIGLIVGLIPLICAKVKPEKGTFRPYQIVLVLVPIAALIAVSHLQGTSAADPAQMIADMDLPYMMFIFVAGMVGAAAMVIPGVSGSVILLLFGIYPMVICSVDSIRQYLLDMSNLSLLMDICKVLGPLALGMAVGAICMVKLMERLMKSYAHVIYSVILGLLIGAIYLVFVTQIDFQDGMSPLLIGIGVATFLVGGSLSFFAGRKRL